MPSGAPAADVEQLIADAQVPGMSMAVIRNGGIETLTVAGVRNARDGAPIDQHAHVGFWHDSEVLAIATTSAAFWG